MEKQKVLVWLPCRKEMTGVTYERPGALLESVRNPFLRLLSSHPALQVSEVEDFRTGLLVGGKAVLGEKPAEGIDAFVWFGEIGRDFRREHSLELLKALEREAKVINCPSGYETAMDKYLTSSFLSRNGIPVPKFILVTPENSEQAAKEIEGWGPVLLKPRLGSYGIGITKVDRPSDIVSIIDYSQPAVHYAEQMIPNDPAKWIGVNVIGGKHAYSYRKGPESFYDGWKVMDRQRVGGKMLLAQPSEEQLAIAEKVARLLGMDWVGVDIITGSDGKPYVIDVNAFPGLYPEMFGQAGIDGPKMMADAVFSRLGV
ncbi:MAG: ATP-grasp domain-containing protein [Candidatus Micrarchaeia archaeon]